MLRVLVCNLRESLIRGWWKGEKRLKADSKRNTYTFIIGTLLRDLLSSSTCFAAVLVLGVLVDVSGGAMSYIREAWRRLTIGTAETKADKTTVIPSKRLVSVMRMVTVFLGDISVFGVWWVKRE